MKSLFARSFPNPYIWVGSIPCSRTFGRELYVHDQ